MISYVIDFRELFSNEWSMVETESYVFSIMSTGSSLLGKESMSS